MLLKFGSESLGGFVKAQIAGLYPQNFLFRPTGVGQQAKNEWVNSAFNHLLLWNKQKSKNGVNTDSSFSFSPM